MARLNKLFALGRHVAEREEHLVVSEDHERLRAALVEHTAMARASRTFGSTRFFLAASAAALVACAALAIVVARLPSKALSFVVGTTRIAGTVGSFISAPDGAPLPVAFSDGTRVTLEPAARARVVSVTSTGADVVLEAGRANVSVVPRPSNKWEVSTGPFVVHVTGTRFDVEWHPDKDEFVLELYEGHVRISGCGLGDGHAVRAGERVEASCGRDEFRVSPLGPRTTPQPNNPFAATASAIDPHASESKADNAFPSDAENGAASPFFGKPASPHGWLALARAGRYADAYAASQATFSESCGTSNAADVLLLADAARFTGHLERARRAYEAVRARFPGTDGASLAAFHLGRTDFDQLGDFASAERWLRIYLEEQPNGAFASAAMGRQMEAEVHRGRLDRARVIAERYLTRYPGGAHADTARGVLAAAPSPR